MNKIYVRCSRFKTVSFLACAMRRRIGAAEANSALEKLRNLLADNKNRKQHAFFELRLTAKKEAVQLQELFKRTSTVLQQHFGDRCLEASIGKLGTKTCLFIYVCLENENVLFEKWGSVDLSVALYQIHKDFGVYFESYFEPRFWHWSRLLELINIGRR